MFALKGNLMEVAWSGLFLMIIGSICSVFIIHQFFPVGEDNHRHWRYSEYFKQHPAKF